jgi:hypothetical protein
MAQELIRPTSLCGNMQEFREKFARVFKKSPTRLPFDDLWGYIG